MDITKKSETFSFVDTDDMYKITGDFTNDVNGTLNINFQVYTAEDNNIGSGNYYQYNAKDNVNFNINCPELDRENIVSSVNSVINNLLNYINTKE